MQINISDPKIIAESTFVNEPDVDRWGQYQFPSLDRLLDGRIAVTFHVNADSAKAYGKAPMAANRGVSSDDGRTWEIVKSDAPVAGLLLPNGDRLRAGVYDVTEPAPEVANLSLPPVRTTGITSYGNEPFNCYRQVELPRKLQGVASARMIADSTTWVKEKARLDDPDALVRTAEGVLPVLWWGDVRLTPDNALLAVVYPHRIEGPDSAYVHCGCYRSEDHGKSWQIQSRLLYRPVNTSDVHAAKRGGFGEPATIILPDGEIVTVLRTTDGNGDGPLYQSRSTDEGKSWSAPTPIRKYGVKPCLLRLGNGVLVLSTGRPGADLAFSFDGRGESWTEPYLLVPIEGPGNQDDSCGYTSLLALDDNSFLVTYSWFRKPTDDGETRKAILMRKVEVAV